MTGSSATRARPEAMRVASVPAQHPYVRGLALPTSAVHVLKDPPIPGAPRGRWWPPVMLDAAWIARHAASFDLMHLHFGFESLGLDDLERVLSELRRVGRPLVYTAHDLSHPQLNDQRPHVEQLSRIVPAADALITLTQAAAAEIERRWHRRAVVISHPAMTSRAPRGQLSSGPALVGVSLRDLRPNIDGVGTIHMLNQALARIPRDDVRAEVTLNCDVRDARQRAEIRVVTRTAPGVALIEGPRPTDPELEDWLARLSVAVLPYRHGTHSGWLELCWDLGLPIAIPRIGCLVDQHPDDELIAAFTPGDPDSFAAALGRLLALPEARPGTLARHRRRDRNQALRHATAARSRDAHLELYRRVSGRPERV